MNKNEKEYIEQYPNEENPYGWFMMISLEEIDDFVSKRQGKKVLMKEDFDKTDTGTLYYE
ncbi:MAG: hypothetical protein RL728_888 [Bacteroidota bacterium]|jgi:hypothetical protein